MGKFICPEKIVLTKDQILMGQRLIAELKKQGLTSKAMLNAILVVCYKEGGLRAKVEDCYNTTPNWRIRQVFGPRVAMYNEAGLNKLKSNCQDFFNQVYSSKWDSTIFGFKTGNDNPGDGYKYRGRALNGITFKVQYIYYGKILGLDLLNKPELLEIPENQAKATAVWFVDGLKREKARLKSKYNVTDYNAVTDYEKALKIAYNLNAGFGNNIDYLIANDTTDGWKMVQCFKNKIPPIVLGAGSLPGTSPVILPLLAIGLFFLVKPEVWKKSNLTRSIKKFFR